MEERSPEIKAELGLRLRRVEGQVRGVSRMVEEDRDCTEILQQMNAIRAAVYQASIMVARAYAARCLEGQPRGTHEAILDTLIATLGKLA